MAKTKWTLFAYLAAHNNLAAFAERSKNQLWQLGSTADVKVVALMDTANGALVYDCDGPSTGRLLQPPGGSFDSGDPVALTTAARWVYSSYPAERYGLVLWSHGTGWMPPQLEAVAKELPVGGAIASGELQERSARSVSTALFRTTVRSMLAKPTPAERAICFDDGTQHALDTLELARVCTDLATAVGQPIDLLGMDACLMASFEVAYQLRNCVGNLAASEEFVPATSWPYDVILKKLQANPGMNGGELARLVVTEYDDFYRHNPPAPKGGDVTKVALDLSAANALKTALDALANVALQNIDAEADNMWAAQYNAQQLESRKGQRDPTKFLFQLWDMASFVKTWEAATSSAHVKAAAHAVLDALATSGFVLLEKHRGKWFDGTCGVSLYAAPPKVQRISPEYPSLDFAKDTAWNTLLDAYHHHYEKQPV